MRDLHALRKVTLCIKTRFGRDYFAGLYRRRRSAMGVNVPIYLRYAMLEEIGVGLGKRRTAKKTVMCGQW